MPWLERRRRRKEADEWRRGNDRRLRDDETAGPTPDDEPPAVDGATPGGAPPTPPEEAPAARTAPDAPTPREGRGGDRVAPRQRPAVPVALGAVSDEDHERAVRRVVARALAEDLAHGADVTSMATVPVGTAGRAALVARDPGVVAGLAVVEEVVRQVDTRIAVELLAEDGDHVEVGQVVARLEGPLRTLLTAERTLLNLVCQLSGVATHTAAFARELEGLDCVVRDTRKTTPGLRLLEKRAVAAGGGANHRVGLYDAVLVKDNHVAAAGGVGAASRAALDGAPDGVHVQVEVTSLEEAEEAMAEGVVDLLLDNFTPEEVAVAVAQIAGRAAVEASGGITLGTARAYAEAGADRLAVGALTHSAPALDLALDVEQVHDATTGALLPPAASPEELEELEAAAADGGTDDDEFVVDRAPYDDGQPREAPPAEVPTREVARAAAPAEAAPVDAPPAGPVDEDVRSGWVPDGAGGWTRRADGDDADGG